MKSVKQLILLSILMLISSMSVLGQNALIRGNVYDKESGEPVSFANVYLEGTSKGTNTNLDGFYTLTDIVPGNYTVIATFIGYDTARVEVKLTKNDIEYTSLYISESSVNIGVVDISASRQTDRTEVKISQVSVSPRQIKALPSVGGEADIAQYLQVIPGVISTGDQGGQLYIRGGSPVQNKILLDGLTIHNPFHSIGFFSVFETELIKNVDVLTGGFGAEYGGRISAIVDIQTRDGNKVRHGGFASVSPFAVKAMVEGPISKFKEGGGSSSFVISTKKSLIDRTSKNLYSYAAQNDSIGLPFSFQDIYAKMAFKSANGSAFNIFGFKFEDSFDDPSLATIEWDNVGVGANFNLIPATSNIIMSGAIGFSNYDLGFVQDQTNDRSSAIRELGANIDFTFFGNNNEFSYGIDLRSIRTDFNFVNPFKQRLEQRQSTTEISGYLKYRQILGNLIIEPSLRLMYYASQSTFSPEPRLGVKYNINDKLRFKFAGGLYSQNLLSTSNERDVVNLFNGFLSGPTSQVTGLNGEPIDNKLQTSRHLVGGFEIDATKNLQFNIEAYLKEFPRLITINRNKLTQSEADYIEEEGEAYGIDLSAKYENRRMYVWATYSYGFVNRFDGEQTYPTIFDRRHNVNFLTTYNLDDDATWQASVRWNFGSGFPFTKTQGFYNYQSFLEGLGTPYTTANPEEIGILYSEDRNDGRLPYYHRLDISLTKKFEFTKYFGLEIVASVTNAYNRDNIFYFDRVEYDRVDQLPTIPSLAVKAKF
ncbi:MAG: TonB-dependent receptor [Saprospiraceae bacterium]|nr:TonB-dependent receptor [Saprospiraceae bacterium]